MKMNRREFGKGFAALVASCFSSFSAKAKLVKSMCASRGEGFTKHGGIDFGDKTVFLVHANAGDTFQFQGMTRIGSNNIVVDWGDGDVYTGTSVPSAHTYAAAGDYYVFVDNTISAFRVYGTSGTRNRSYEFLHWGDDITAANIGNLGSFENCTGLTGTIPAWNNVITSAWYTFENCTGLTGTIPAWNDVITNVAYAYYGCRGLTGSVPKWNNVVTDADFTYRECTGLTGTIPKWNDVITKCNNTYRNCIGLTGSVPKWNDVMVEADYTFTGCKNLTGNVPEWNSAMTKSIWTYEFCTGLTGVIPAWGPSMTQAEETYYGCTGLTGVWDPSATDEELMPSRITNFSSCVSKASAALRAYFLTTWGGTRTA